MSIFVPVDTARAWAEIDLDAMASNLEVVRSRIDPTTSLMLVAKADAYGHGAIAVAHHAALRGADAIGVTNCQEALELRQAGLQGRIVVLGPVLGEEALSAIRAGVEFCVPSVALAEAVEEVSSSRGHRARVHLKVETGMGRLGLPPSQALQLLRRIQASPALELAGVMTHLAATEGARSAAAQLQMARFERFLEDARRSQLLNGKDVWIHSANSAAVLSGIRPLYDAVRIGIAAFGISPDPSLDTAELLPVLSVRTRVVHLSTLQGGESVGYGGTWTAKRTSRIAVLPVGYDDGVNWRLSNRGVVLVRGQRAPIVGRVSMDYTTVDVTEIPGVGLGDRATLIGEDGAQRIRVEELAEIVGTVPHELTCSIGKRVARIYVAEKAAPMPPISSTPSAVS